MPKYNPLVSIIVNTHNSVEFIREALASAFAQTYKNTEIIVYDNASTKDILKALKEYAPKIKYVRSEKFLTLGQARNEALKIANGVLIDFLDADDIFLPEKLEKQVPLFEDPEVGLVYANSIHFTHEGEKIYENLIHREPKPEGKIFGKLLHGNLISFDTAIFRKSAIGKDPAKWFPENFNLATDYDLFLRISYNYKVRYLCEGLSKWRYHGQNWSKVKKHLEPAELTLLIPNILEYEPDLMKKYKKDMKVYMSNIYRSQGVFFWSIGAKWQGFLSLISSSLQTFSPQDVVKALSVPFFSYKNYQEKIEFIKKRFLN